MPALPDVPSVLKIALRYTVGIDSNAINRFYFRYAGADPDLAALNTFLGQVATDWHTDLAPLASGDVELNEVTGTVLTSVTSPEASIPTAYTGSRGAGFLGAAVAAVLQCKVGRRYRGGHCRLYLPFGVESDVGVGIQGWNSAFITACETGWATFMSDLNTHIWPGGTSGQQVNVSYYQGFTNVLYPSGRYRAVPTRRTTPVVDDVEEWVLNPRFGSQRRRNLQTP